MSLKLDFDLLTEDIVVSKREAQTWKAQNKSVLKIVRDQGNDITDNEDEGFCDSNVIGDKISKGQDRNPVEAFVNSMINNYVNKNVEDEGIYV
jgi:hypothetical protein